MRKHLLNRRSLPSLRLQILSLIAAGLTISACEEPTEPEPVRLEVISDPLPAEEGILVNVPTLAVRVTELDGTTVQGRRVVWAVTKGEGAVRRAVGGYNVPQALADTSVSDSLGVARAYWVLGPIVGEQELTVSARGADPVRFQIQATPGVVFLGVWRDLDPELREKLPSDTMLVHATQLGTIREAREGLAAGTMFHIEGKIKPGPGLDPRWPFHFIRASISIHSREPAAGWRSCSSGLLLTPEDVEEAIAEWSGQYCPERFYLVGIEEVPEAYLEGLAES